MDSEESIQPRLLTVGRSMTRLRLDDDPLDARLLRAVGSALCGRGRRRAPGRGGPGHRPRVLVHGLDRSRRAGPRAGPDRGGGRAPHHRAVGVPAGLNVLPDRRHDAVRGAADPRKAAANAAQTTVHNGRTCGRDHLPAWVCNAEGDEIGASAPQLVAALRTDKQFRPLHRRGGRGPPLRAGRAVALPRPVLRLSRLSLLEPSRQTGVMGMLA